MSFQVRESFQLHAPIDRVWDYLADPRQVVTCLPGAELISVENATTYRGRVKVKVGPVTASYDGTVLLLERDNHRHVVRIRGEGREHGGSGSASMTMTSTVTALPDGMTQVDVSADIDIVGRVVHFGRGMIDSVNKQLFKQFTACLTTTLEQPIAAVPLPLSNDTPLDATAANGTVSGRPVRLLTLIWAAMVGWLRGALSAER